MKVRARTALASIALIAAAACAPGVGAESPIAPVGSSSPAAGPAQQVFPTSTPWPQFGPPPTTAESATAIAQAVQPTPTSLVATPTTPAIFAAPDEDPPVVAPTPTPVGPATPADESGTFEPVLDYTYSVPLDWDDIVGDDEIVLAHASGLARVTLRELLVDRAQVQSVIDLSNTRQPVEFVDWSERSLSDARVTDGRSIRQEYVGTRLGEQFMAVVDWYLLGELLVEVVTEVEANSWALDTNLRNTATLTAESFAPDGSVPLMTATEIDNQLNVRFSQNPSNIFMDATNGGPPIHLSCRQVLLDLLSEPVYVGDGEWQVFAVTEQGAQVWQVFEPGLSIHPAAHNTSSC